jgi:hypothetical protein
MRAPWWLRFLTGLGVAAIGLLALWINSRDPVFGIPLDDPACYVFMALFALSGLAVAVWPRIWERERPPVSLPEPARELTDRHDERP